MTGGPQALVLRRFEDPDEVRHMEKGRFEIVRLGEITIGRVTYEPDISLHFLGAEHYAR